MRSGLNYAAALIVNCETSFAVLAGKTQPADGIDPASSTEAECKQRLSCTVV